MYSLKERRVFVIELADGTVVRHDPMEVWAQANARMAEDGWEYDLIARDLGEPHPLQRAEAERRFAALGRAAFALPEFDPATGLGYTGSDCFHLWIGFCEWESKLAGFTAATPSGSRPTADSPPGDSAAAGGVA